MKKLFVFLALGLAFTFSAASQTAVDLDAAIRQAGGEIFTALIEGPKVALLSISSPAKELSEYVLKEIGLELEKRRCTVTDRASVNRTLEAKNLNISSEVGEAASRDIGKNLSTLYVITGSIEKSGNNYRFIYNLRSVNNAAIKTMTTITVRDNSQIQRFLSQSPAPTTPVALGPAAVPTPRAEPVVPAQTQPAAAPRANNIGDTGPAGGLIFYDKGNNSNGWRYLEAAPVEAELQVIWSVRNTKVENTQELIGSGKRNTQLIVDTFKQTTGEWDTAAQKVDDLVFNGFSD